MRYIILTLLLINTSCGKMTDEVCTTDVCFDIFGHKEDTSDLENRIAALESQGVHTMNFLSLLLNTTTDHSDMLEAIDYDIRSLYLDIGNIYTQIASITPLVVNNTYITYSNDVSIYDPCPDVDSSGPKEYLIKIGSQYIAYFETGHSSSSDRFLTVLRAGTQYRTTDSRECLFTVE